MPWGRIVPFAMGKLSRGDLVVRNPRIVSGGVRSRSHCVCHGGSHPNVEGHDVRMGHRASRERLARFIVAYAGMGSFDFTDASLREAPAALKMTIEVIRQTRDN